MIAGRGLPAHPGPRNASVVGLLGGGCRYGGQGGGRMESGLSHSLYSRIPTVAEMGRVGFLRC